MKRKLFIIPLLIFTLLLTAGFKGCPSEDELTTMAKASRELSHDVLVAEQSVGALYQGGKISLEAKDKAAAKLKLIAVNGQRFNATLVELNKKYPQGNPPPETLQLLRDNWQSVIVPFQELYRELTDKSAVKDLKRDTDKITEVLK